MRSKRTLRWRALLVAGLLLVLGVSACQRGASDGTQHRRALLILLDAARADRFSTNGYGRDTTPRIATMAERGVVFLRAYSQATDTRAALPALFYSRYFARPMFPASRRVPFADPEQLFHPIDAEAIALPEAFSQAGFTTAMISAHGWTLDASPLARSFSQSYHLPQLLDYPKHYGAPRAEQVVDFALEWLDEHRREDFFLYLHLMDTHFPHHLDKISRKFLPPNGLPEVDRSRFDGRRSLDPTMEYSEDDRLYLNALYDGSLKYTDRHLGRLFDRLRRRGWLDDMLIVLTADHGEHLLEHPQRWDHGGPWYEAVARVPLIVIRPGSMSPAKSELLAGIVDIMPTMLGQFGIELAEGKSMDGVDLAGLARGDVPPREALLAGHAGIRDERYKALFRKRPAALFTESTPDAAGIGGELYDLAEDPEEQVNQWAAQPARAMRLFRNWRQGLGRKFLRFERSYSTAQPETSFAIGSLYVVAEQEVPVLQNGKDPAEIARRSLDSGGWVRSLHWQNHQIFAQPWAEPQRFSLKIPDGFYAVSLGMRGAARVQLRDQMEALELRSGSEARFDTSRPPAVEELPCGIVEVEGQEFSVQLEPLESSRLLLYYIGFVPLMPGSEDVPEEDLEQLERLRSLGYIQ